MTPLIICTVILGWAHFLMDTNGLIKYRNQSSAELKEEIETVVDLNSKGIKILATVSVFFFEMLFYMLAIGTTKNPYLMLVGQAILAFQIYKVVKLWAYGLEVSTNPRTIRRYTIYAIETGFLLAYTYMAIWG